MEHLIWLIPALPLAGFLLLVAFGRRMGEPAAGWLATTMVAASFVASIAVFLDARGSAGGRGHILVESLFTWFSAGSFHAEVGFVADPLSITMCLFVTGIAALIHVYSVGYMHGDPNYSKFFVYMNLFVFSMVMLVLADNLLITFLGWEGVGACSYFLVSFWFTSEANASAGKKAFVTNRIGDVGFMAAIFVTFLAVGSIRYADLIGHASTLATTTATAIAILLFIGAVGKSAQIPLFVWLPDAMAGPTPVSALIHAATMVTAGVYLMVRVNPVLAQASPWVLTFIAIIGALTALLAATIAVAQNDIKRVLAYSTISQLGYMFLAVGSGAYVAAIFQMITHAFFKALLFLGAGSVIHGMGEEQDMRRMGALRKVMPITAITFMVGWLAIAGVFPFAGFWSKDDILLAAYDKSPALWAVGLITAVLTGFYMSRQVFLVFFGKARWGEADAATGEAEQSAAGVTDSSGETSTHAEDEKAAPVAQAVASSAADPPSGAGHGGHDVHPHESPWQMTFPLIVLAGLAAVGGALDLPILSRLLYLDHWLEPVVLGEVDLTATTNTKLILAGLALLGALIGIFLAARVYLRGKGNRAKIEAPVLANGWYIDSSIAAFVAGPGTRFFDAVAWFDKAIIDGAVNGIATLVRGSGDRLRRLQTGYVRNYALGVAVGAILLVGALLSRAAF